MLYMHICSKYLLGVVLNLNFAAFTCTGYVSIRTNMALVTDMLSHTVHHPCMVADILLFWATRSACNLQSCDKHAHWGCKWVLEPSLVHAGGHEQNGQQAE